MIAGKAWSSVLLLAALSLSALMASASDDTNDAVHAPVARPDGSDGVTAVVRFFDEDSSEGSPRESSYGADDEREEAGKGPDRGIKRFRKAVKKVIHSDVHFDLDDVVDILRPPTSKEEWLNHLQNLQDIDSPLDSATSDTEDYDPTRSWSKDELPRRRPFNRLLGMRVGSDDSDDGDPDDDISEEVLSSSYTGSSISGSASCVFFGAWNMNGQQPMKSDLKAWLSGYQNCGVYAITFQECDVGCSKQSHYIDNAISEILGGDGDDGVTLVSRKQSHYSGSFAHKRLDKSFGRIHGNTRLDIYLRKSSFKTAYVEGSYMVNLNRMGKASIATSIYVDDVRFLFIGVHLSASFSPFTPEKYIAQRNRDIENTFIGVEQRFGLLESFSGVFLGGDLNYRVDIREKVFDAYIGGLKKPVENLSIDNYPCAKHVNSKWILEFLELERDSACINAIQRVRESMLSAALVSMRPHMDDSDDDRAQLANDFKNYQTIFENYDELRRLKAGAYPSLKNWIHDYGLEIVPVKDYSTWPFTFSRVIGEQCPWDDPNLFTALEGVRKCYQGAKNENVYGLLTVKPGVAALGRGEMLPAWTDAVLSRSACTTAECQEANMEATMSAEDSVISSDHLPIRSVHSLGAYEKNHLSSLNLRVMMRGHKVTHGFWKKVRYVYKFYKSLDGCKWKVPSDVWSIQNISDQEGLPVLKNGFTDDSRHTFFSRYMEASCILVRVPLVKSGEKDSGFDYLVWTRVDEDVINQLEVKRIYEDALLSLPISYGLSRDHEQQVRPAVTDG